MAKLLSVAYLHLKPYGDGNNVRIVVTNNLHICDILVIRWRVQI